jgi:Ser/Thr protein kinase RdoA (MazF antagonist)
VTVELLGTDAPSGLELLIAWLVPLNELDGRDVGPQRDSGASLPFSLVQCVAGSDDKVTDSGIYQVDDFAATFDEAEARNDLHRHLLRRFSVDVGEAALGGLRG